MEKMRKILNCDVKGCSYNKDTHCRALAITIGHPAASCAMSHPACDTFVSMAKKGGVADATAGVGACKEDCCEFNNMLACNAPGVHVGLHRSHADCMTFRAR
ncbi:MAG: DUF1540 domain-containing protein [Syntrophales bacterium]|nr:DUF1540 domain-containing protein [Syntrophales bacterium]